MGKQLPSINLVVQNGAHSGQVFTIQAQSQIIGRGSGSDIIITDKSLSRRHARLKATPHGYAIEDLGSTNGTYVNEKQIGGSAPVRPGDTIRLGTTITVTVQLQPGAVGRTDHQETLVSRTEVVRGGPDHTMVPDSTVVPGGVSHAHHIPPTPIVQPQRSGLNPWLWVMAAVIVALLIIAGTLGFLRFSSLSQPAPTEVAQPPTPTPTNTSEPTTTPSPEPTSTPEPLSVPGVAAVTAQQKLLPQDAIEIDPFCQTQVEVSPNEAVYVKWEQRLAEADSETNYLVEWLNYAYYEVTLDGRPINTFNYYPNEDSTLNLWHNLGLLSPGTHFLRIQWYTSREISNGLDIEPADGQVDTFGPGPVGEGFCEIVVPEPIAAVTFTPTPTLTPLPDATVTPTPTAKQAQTSSSPAPLGIFQDFESAGTWKRGDQPYGELTRSSNQVHSGSYAGQLSYNFSTPDNDYVVFLQSRSLAGRPNAISAWIYGDGSGHFLNVWIKDAGGQSWSMNFGRVNHTGWQEMTAFLDPGQPWPSGHISGPDNGAIDYPISFQAIVLDDGSDDYSGRGTIYIDDLNSQEGAAPPTPMPTVVTQVGVPAPAVGQPGSGPASSGGYMLYVGSKHLYEQPWGAARNGDVCRTYNEGSWDDRNPNFRGFNLQLLLTNNSTVAVPDAWLPTYTTAGGQSGQFCYHSYGGGRGTGVAPGATGDVTFFALVPGGDYVNTVQLMVNGQTLQLCLGPDGSGGACGQQTGGPVVVQPAPAPASSIYALAIGGQHRYEEPWGAPRDGNPCRAWENNDWDDKNANFRGFNVELLFTNNSSAKVQDDWGENMRFFTAGEQEVTACYYGYAGAGPPPRGTTSLTFFSVVPRGDFVQTMQLNLNGQFTQICLDGRGGWSPC